jgi:hypothetical protein
LVAFIALVTTLALAGTAAATETCGAPPARSAKTRPTLTVTPSSTPADKVVVFHGTHWGIGEFCSAKVTLMVKAKFGQLGIHVGDARVNRTGSFTFRWHVPEAESIGTVLHILGRQYCTGGANGATITRERVVTIRIVGLPA